jgi:GNAT superfamily N-acetyltransferase
VEGSLKACRFTATTDSWEKDESVMSQTIPQPLSPEDIPANVGLAHAVGWHDWEGDWRVIHAGALVLGVRSGTELLGQGALGLYGESGTIAKMIVSPTQQRRGIGKQLLESLLDEAKRRGVHTLGLVATPSGQPLYAQHDFQLTGEVVVLTGTPDVRDTKMPRLPTLADVRVAATVDQRWLQCNRSKMLKARLHEAVASAAIARPASTLAGYAMATSQGPHALVGPIVSETEEDARQLALALFGTVRGPVRIDVPAEQVTFRRWLVGLGLVEQSTRAEMALGALRLPWQVPQRFALAAQAWG